MASNCVLSYLMTEDDTHFDGMIGMIGMNLTKSERACLDWFDRQGRLRILLRDPKTHRLTVSNPAKFECVEVDRKPDNQAVLEHLDMNALIDQLSVTETHETTQHFQQFIQLGQIFCDYGDDWARKRYTFTHKCLTKIIAHVKMTATPTFIRIPRAKHV